MAALTVDNELGRGKYIVYVTSRKVSDQLGHGLAMRLRAAYSRLRRNSNLVFSSFGMTSDQFVLLTVLAQEGMATQQELVERCSSDSATIGAMVSLLEAKGLLSRKRHPQDGRAWSLRLTDSGRGLATAMWRSSSSLRTRLVTLFDEEELRTLLEFLERFAEGMPQPKRRTIVKSRE
jgi:DNA-binding MarR family transcriptional regulator